MTYFASILVLLLAMSASAELFDITDPLYGAIPNDGLDDTVGINAAVSACNAACGTHDGIESDCSVTYWPTGVYDIDTEVLLTECGFRAEMPGTRGSIVRWNGADNDGSAAFKVSLTTGGGQIELSGLSIRAGDNNPTNCIRFEGGSKVIDWATRLDNIHCVDPDGDGIYIKDVNAVNMDWHARCDGTLKHCFGWDRPLGGSTEYVRLDLVPAWSQTRQGYGAIRITTANTSGRGTLVLNGERWETGVGLASYAGHKCWAIEEQTTGQAFPLFNALVEGVSIQDVGNVSDDKVFCYERGATATVRPKVTFIDLVLNQVGDTTSPGLIGGDLKATVGNVDVFGNAVSLVYAYAHGDNIPHMLNEAHDSMALSMSGDNEAVAAESWITGESFPRMRQTADGLMFCGDGTESPGGTCSPSPFCRGDYDEDGDVDTVDFLDGFKPEFDAPQPNDCQ